jgi:hypothetical protein
MSDTLYESQTSGVTNNLFYGSAEEVAQIFIPQTTHAITSFKIYGYRVNNSGTVYFGVKSVSGGVPYSFLTISSIAQASIPTGSAWIELTLETPYILTAGTSYALVLTAPFATGAGGQMCWMFNTEGGYSNGAFFLYNGSSWSEQSGYDLMFMEYGVTVPTAPSSIHVDSKTTTTITIHWTDNATNEADYHLFKNDADIAQIAAGSTSYEFTGLTSDTEYDLAVKAHNAGGYSSEAQITARTNGLGGLFFCMG